jgi:hypothetical protein
LPFFRNKGTSQNSKKLYNEDRLSREHIKILIGLHNTDENRKMKNKDRFVQDLTDSVINSIKTAFTSQELDDEDIHDQVRFFVKLLKEKNNSHKKTIKLNHAKLYLFKTK